MSEQWPVDLPVARVRIARPTDRLEEVVAFYRDGIGLPVSGSFEGHAGYSGIMLGLPGTNYHLEFTHYDGGSDCPAPSRDNLLVFYLYDRAAMDRIVERLRAMGYPTVPPENPSSFRKIVERLRWIRDLDLKPGVLSRIHHNRLQQLRREGERMTAQRLNQFDAARRDATLVSFLLATEEDLVDQALDMHEKLLGLHAKKRRAQSPSGSGCLGTVLAPFYAFADR